MKRLIARIVAGAGFVAGCCLLQGCVTKQQPLEVEPIDVDLPVEPESAEVTETKVIEPVATTTAYTVQKGDTITGIAVRYGLRWQGVVAVNPGISPNKLQIGQTIQLPGEVDLTKTAASHASAKAAPAPSRNETVYVVKSGDTLSGIAQSHGVKTADILKANEMKDANKIAVGQKLKIPGAAKSEAKVESSKPVVTAARIDPPKKIEVKAEVAPPAVPAKVEEAKEKVEAEAAAAKEAVQAAETAGQKYTVKAGEDLYAVAIRWGVSPSDLKALNKLTSSELKEGMVLDIPNAAQ